MYSSTRMQPLSISMPEPSSQAVAGRMPMASTTMSAGSAPFGVSTPAARPAASPSPARMPVSGVEVMTRQPEALSWRVAHAAISGS